MKIALVTNAAYSIPVLQSLNGSGIQASVFSGACTNTPADDTAPIVYYCNATKQRHAIAAPDTLYNWLALEQPALVLVLGYSHIIHVNLLPDGLADHSYNIHFGPLPAYRGPNPVFWQLKNGEPTIGLAIHRLTRQVDAGDVVWSKQIPHEPYLTFGIANMILAQVCMEGLAMIIQHTYQRKPIMAKSQSKPLATYNPRPQLNDVLIDWNSLNAQQVCNLICACNPWNKGAITLLKNREIKILDAEALPAYNMPANGPQTAGTIVHADDSVIIRCQHETFLKANMFVVEGNFVPARHAAVFGLVAGEIFGN